MYTHTSNRHLLLEPTSDTCPLHSTMVPPIVIATLQSASISLCSCVFAMLFSRTTPPVLAFLIFTFISTPPNFLWQQFLERRFPGYIVQKLDADEKGVKKRLNIRNTLAKLLLDQSLGSFVNTAAFVGAVRLLRGDSLDGALIAVKEVRTIHTQLRGKPSFFLEMLLISRKADECYVANFANHACRIQAVAGIQCNQLHTCAS